MRKIIFTIVLLFFALNSNAAISQSGITNLKQLDKNGIIDLVNGNQLIGFISDGPFDGPITQTYFKDGTYETVYENKTYKGKWRAEGESYSSVNDKKMCTKNNDASKWSCFHWYTGNKDGGTYAYIIAYGQIFHQYHKVISIEEANQEIKKAKEKKKKTEEQRIAKNKHKLNESIQIETKSLKSYLKTLEELNMSSYKVEADKLMNEFKNNNNPQDFELRNYKFKLEKLNSLIRKAILDEEKRIADEKKAEEKRIADEKKAEEKRIADEKKAEEKRIADEKKAEEKRIAEVKYAEKRLENAVKDLNNHLNKLKNLKLDSIKVKVENLLSEVKTNISSDLSKLRGLTKTLRDMNSSVELKIKTEEKRIFDEKKAEDKRQRRLSLIDYPGFKDLKPGLHYDDLKEFCPLRKNAWVQCYGIDNIKFQGIYQSNVLKQLTLDMGPIVNTSGFLSVFGENDSNIFIKMQNNFDKKYTFDYGYSERDRQLFNESEKSHLYRVYSKGQVVLEIGRKEKDWSSDLWLYIHYFESSKAERFLKENRPIRASEDDF